MYAQTPSEGAQLNSFVCCTKNNFKKKTSAGVLLSEKYCKWANLLENLFPMAASIEPATTHYHYNHIITTIINDTSAEKLISSGFGGKMDAPMYSIYYNILHYSVLYP